MKRFYFLFFFGISLSLFLIGFYIIVMYTPAYEIGEELKNEVLSSSRRVYSSIRYYSDSRTISEKVDSWIREESSVARPVLPSPNWSHAFFSPLSVRGLGADPSMEFCRLNFQKYAKAPHLLPMFKDLVASSGCDSDGVMHSVRLSEVKREIAHVKGSVAGRVVYPTAFVFHESRVGSTLVANMLGSDPFNMVYSESAPPASILLRANVRTQSAHVALFRDIVTVMGRSPIHKRLFFKFQSITTTAINIALQAFPDVPWVFVYREPVQTMMSHMDPWSLPGVSYPPCLRSKSEHPPDKVRIALEIAGGMRNAPDEAWCAAHLRMLCEYALEAFSQYGKYGADAITAHERQKAEGFVRAGRLAYGIKVGFERGMLVNYESLPGFVPEILLKLFGVEGSLTWTANMKLEAAAYSKSSSKNILKAGKFSEDSKWKEAMASAAIEKWAHEILGQSFHEMLNRTEEVLVAMDHDTPRDENGKVDWNAMKPIKSGRTMAVGEEPLFNPFISTHNSTPFERISCPPKPAVGYPRGYNMEAILSNWNPDDSNIPSKHFHSLCRFDYQSERDIASAYRREEVPFIVYNVPEVDEVVRKWSNLDYLSGKIGQSPYRSEVSRSNHFMYWNSFHGKSPFFKNKDGSVWHAPTSHASYTFEEWLRTAISGYNKNSTDRENVYFRVSSAGDRSWLFEELPFFQPKRSFFVVDPSQQRGIHCRFGMRSVIAECHFDGSRNFAASFGGLRRWILADPDQCTNLYLYPKGHPSARHSEIDWSNVNFDQYPRFRTAKANEVILKPGEVLYLPTFWFHYIVSLSINFQCNTRSGVGRIKANDITKCGF